MLKVRVNIVFVIIFLWLIWATDLITGLSYFFAILFHELAHFLVAKRCGYKLSQFSLCPYGVNLTYGGQTFEYSDEVKIALAGPFANIVSALFVVAIWWLFPATYSFLRDFVFVSAVIALTNLLPAYPLDGGRVFVVASSKFLGRKTALKVTIVVNAILSVLFFTLFFIFCFINFNPTYLLFAVFLVLGCLDLKFLSVYEKMSVFNKTYKNFSKPHFVIIGEEVAVRDIVRKIVPNKTTIFVFIDKNGNVIFFPDKKILDFLSKNKYKENIIYKINNKNAKNS